MGKRVSVLLAVALLCAQGVASAAATPAADPPRARDRFEAMPSPELQSDGTASAASGAPTSVIELRGDDAALQAAVAEAGGVVLGDASGVVHARVPFAEVAALQDHPGVQSVGTAPRFRQAVESEGVDTTGARTWLDDGSDGTGVDVAIVDLGFAGYEAALGTELPADVETSFGACADTDTTEHGTAVAEIVHDMAPGATLHLICVDSTFDMDAGSPIFTYLEGNGIEVANASFGSVTDSRGDGQGAVDRAVNQSRRDGTLWVVSSGNNGNGHVAIPRGAPIQRRFLVEDPSFYVDAVDANTGAAVDPFISFTVPANGIVGVEARWDAFPNTQIDFDLFVFTTEQFSEAGFLTGSFADQQTQNLAPIEGLAFQNTSGVARTFYLLVDAYNPVSVPIDIFFQGQYANVQYNQPSGSVSEPGTSAGALTVGAACAANNALEAYSSQGPTVDGRVKPDLVGPDGTSSSVYGAAAGPGCSGGFTGTSASAPHVAGAAALVLDAQPSLGPTDVQGILERRATPAGAAGKDNQWGWGRLALGAADEPTAPTGHLFTGLSPAARALDTRVTADPITGGATKQLQIAGTHGVPADATAVVLSVVALRPTAAGYLTTFPQGAARPVAASVNFAKGAVVSNSVTVGLGPTGAISIFNYAGTTQVVVDIAGWYGPTGTNGLEAVAPIRAVDTRPGRSTRIPVPGGDIGGTEVLTAQLAGNPAIPEVPATATAVVLNAAVLSSSITGHLTVWPDGTAKPLASNLNFNKGATVANLVVAKTGAGGRVHVATNAGKAHVVLDIVGYYDPSAPGRFVPLPTVNRVLDTRTGNGSLRRPAPANQTLQVEISELFGVPGNASSVVLNVTTVTPEAATGHLRVWGIGPLPTASTLNFTRGAVIGNAAVVGLGASAVLLDGRFGIYNSSVAGAHVVADASGYFVDAP